MCMNPPFSTVLDSKEAKEMTPKALKVLDWCYRGLVPHVGML